MPQLGSSGIQALVSSFTDKDVDQALKEIAKKIARSVDDVNNGLNKIKIDKDVIDNLANQLKALPEELQKKTQGMSFDLFSDLINADGAEEKIDEAFKIFSSKIEAFNKLKNTINNDEILIKTDLSDLDKLIKKEQKILEIETQIQGLRKNTRVYREGSSQISSIENEIVAYAKNRKEIEKYNVSLEEVEKNIKNLATINRSQIGKGIIDDSNVDEIKEIIGWLERYSQLTGDLSGLKSLNIPGVKELQNIFQGNTKFINSDIEKEIEGFRDIVKKYSSDFKVLGGTQFFGGADVQKLKEQEQEINNMKKALSEKESQLEQVNQKYIEQSNLVNKLGNDLEALKESKNPKIIETDEYKNIISELETAKNKASEFQKEMDKLNQTVEVLKGSLSSYDTGNVVPRQDFENANRVIDNLNDKINELETSLTETKNKFASLSSEVTKLQQDKSDLGGQLSQQKEINSAQQEQIANQSKIQEELKKTKNELNELLATIAKLQDIQKNAISTIENYGEIEEFKKASKIIGYNEGIDTPENFVSFDYLEKAKQKIQELGKEYDKLDVKASVYYNQYLQKGGTEKIFDANGKDVSNELISLYTEMSSLINQTGDISIETAQKILRSVNSQIYSLNEEKKALQNKNKELEKAAKLEEKVAKAKKENQKVQQEQTKTPTAKRSSISQEQFRKDMEREQAKAQSNIDNTTGKGTSQVDSSSIVSEQQALEKLEQAIKSVTIAIAEKNKAIQAEEVQMDKSVNSEIAKLEELKSKLNEIKTQFENGITSGLFKNVNSEDVDGTSVNVDLKPTVDVNKFKEDAEHLLTFVDVEKEVNLKVGELNTSNTTDATSTVTSPVFENITNDNVIEEQNKDIEEQQRLYNNIIRLLTEYLSLQDRINSGNRDIASGDLINSNDIRKQTGKVSQRAVKDQLKDYLSISKNENSIYSDKTINYTKNKLAAYVDDFNNAEKAAEIFGNKNKELFNEITQMINDAKVSLDAYNKAQLKIDVINNQLVELNKLQSGEKLTFGQLWDLEKVVKTDGLEAGLKYITDELGIKIPEAAQKAESAIAEVNDELSKPQQQQIPLIEIQVDDKQESKESEKLTVPVEPLLNQKEWEDKIDEIIRLIGTKKINIEPDMTSEEWNTLKNYIDNISKQVINMKFVNGDSALPSDLNTSYKNSEKYLKEIWSLNEKIAQAKEKNSEQDLKQVASYENRKRQLGELLKLEQQFREDDRFDSVDTSSRDNSLNKLTNTLIQEYKANRQEFISNLQSSMADIEENAYKDNDVFNNKQRIAEAEKTYNRLTQLYNDYVNNIEEQSQLELKGSNITDDEEERLVQLRQEYLDLTKKVNQALTEEQGKTTAISKVLESIKNAQELGINGVTGVNDTDKAYDEANKINNALNNTQKNMSELSRLGTTSFFNQIFSDAENEVKSFNNQLINNEITLTEYNKKVKETQTLLSKQTNAVAFFDPGDMEQTMQQMIQIASQIPGIKDDTLKWSNANRTLTAMLEDQTGEWKKLTLNAQKAGNTITLSFTNAQRPATSLSKFIDELGAKFRNLGAYLLSFVGFYEVWGAIKQGFTYVKEFDTALTEMRKVSDETVQSLQRFQEESFDIANSVGTTAKVIQDSTADWMRLGESIDEATESAKVSNVLLNVSEFENIDDATDALVSMSQAYTEFEKIDIVDKLNNIGNNYSIATDGIATALQDSASALTTAGNSLDEAIALVTAGNAIVQDPNSVGSGLRTIALRLTGTEQAKEELEALGEETDGYAETVSKLRDTIMSATKVASNSFEGFDILDENGNYKSTYEILQGIADVYAEIVETDKEYGTNNVNLLLETLAGKNRANIAASILQNPDMLRNVFEDSQNSAGSAQQELEKYLDSIEGKINTLTNNVQEFWATVIDSDMVKTILDVLSNMVSFATDFVDIIGTAPIVITAITTAFDKISGINLFSGGGRAKKYAKIFMILGKLITHRRFNLVIGN